MYTVKVEMSRNTTTTEVVLEMTSKQFDRNVLGTIMAQFYLMSDDGQNLYNAIEYIREQKRRPFVISNYPYTMTLQNVKQ